MDLWNAFIGEVGKSDFQNKKLDLRTGNRWNASVGQIADRSVEVTRNEARFIKYSEYNRYMLAREISHDLFFTVYDVDTRKLIGGRLTSVISKDDAVRVAALALKERMHNTEMRIIGLQDGEADLIGSVELLHKELKCRLIEVDLFGGEMRHIAMDASTGSSYNLLLLNRIYRPGELANTVTAQDFEAMKASKLNFANGLVDGPAAGKRAPLKHH